MPSPLLASCDEIAKIPALTPAALAIARASRTASAVRPLLPPFALTFAGGFALLLRVKRQSNQAASIPSARWTAYALAGLATMPGLAARAEAEIHYSGRIESHLVNIDTFLPLSGGASLLFDHEFGSANYFAYMWVFGVSQQGVATDPTSFLFAAAKLRPRVNVSTAGRFHSYAKLINTFDYGHWTRRGQGIAAFEFNTGRGIQYGWVRVRTTRGGVLNQLEVIDYAWADPGEPILTGQTREGIAPETDKVNEDTAVNQPRSGSLGLLALGRIGLQAWRESRSDRVDSDAP